MPLPTCSYQGVVNALVVSRRRLERFYWTIVVDPRFPFQGVVETTHVIPPEWIGGRHLIYLMNYCDADSEPYRRSDDAGDGARRSRASRALYPRFTPADVEERLRVPRPARRAGLDASAISASVRRRASAQPRSTSAPPRRPIRASPPGTPASALARETVTALLADLGRAAAAAG